MVLLLMVMPRSRSMSIESRIWSRKSRASTPPQRWMRRSARVDFPWSMCAMMQKLRMSSKTIYLEQASSRRLAGGAVRNPTSGELVLHWNGEAYAVIPLSWMEQIRQQDLGKDRVRRRVLGDVVGPAREDRDQLEGG